MTKAHWSRRQWLGGAAGGFSALALRNGYHRLWAAPANGPATRCLVLWMNGGPSQLETIDPKPGAATGGPTQAISTSVPGVAVSEHLPQIAHRMERLNLVRNLTSSEGEHLRARYLMHTGFPIVPGFPRPALGSVLAERLGTGDLPNFVSIGGQGFGPAYAGMEAAPFVIDEPDEALELLRRIRNRRGSFSLLRSLGRHFGARHAHPDLMLRQATLDRIERLVETPLVSALDLDLEPQSHRHKYGEHEFGRHCLLARRLLEAGVRCVEVQLDGWDTHQNNFRATRSLCEQLDQPWCQLLDDLESSGLWGETIVLWMGEFGRTPRINANQGRDHFPRVTPVVFGGGGFSGGGLIGETNPQGTEIAGPSVGIADLFATLLQQLGIDPEYHYTTEFGSPAAVTDNGRPIAW